MVASHLVKYSHHPDVGPMHQLEPGLLAGVGKMKCPLPISGSSLENNLLVFNQMQ
jgi:hypothetical protein